MVIHQKSCRGGVTPPTTQNGDSPKKQLGLVLQAWLEQLTTYQEEPVYQAVKRFFEENFILTVPKDRAISSQRRRRFERSKEEARSLRPAVEATVFQVKHALQRGIVRVRGLFRTASVITCSALAVNLRRLHRYENDRQRGKLTAKVARHAFLAAFFRPLKTRSKLAYELLSGFRISFSCERTMQGSCTVKDENVVVCSLYSRQSFIPHW